MSQWLRKIQTLIVVPGVYWAQIIPVEEVLLPNKTITDIPLWQGIALLSLASPPKVNFFVTAAKNFNAYPGMMVYTFSRGQGLEMAKFPVIASHSCPDLAGGRNLTTCVKSGWERLSPGAPLLLADFPTHDPQLDCGSPSTDLIIGVVTSMLRETTPHSHAGTSCVLTGPMQDWILEHTSLH
eukprot:evm.model.scf_586.4 EVM.evm.TU.scf_586.4   scf_586:59932-60887(-)